MIGCLPRVLEVPRVVDDTEVPRILWVKCATSAECKTIRIAVSMVKDSWAVLLINYIQSFTNHVYVLIKLFGLSQMLDTMIKLDWCPTPLMLISVTCSYGYLYSHDTYFTCG